MRRSVTEKIAGEPSGVSPCRWKPDGALSARRRRESRQGVRSTRLLFVGKDPGVRRSARVRLRKSGFDIIATADGPTALSAACDDPPDLIVVDHAVHRIDVHNLLTRFARDVHTAGIPLLFLAERSDDVFELACRALGVTWLDGGDEKPFLKLCVGAAGARPAKRRPTSSKRSGTESNVHRSFMGDQGRVSTRPAEAPQWAGRSASPRRYGPVPMDGESC
jgi:CheY-like chemotaxis protein